MKKILLILVILNPSIVNAEGQYYQKNLGDGKGYNNSQFLNQQNKDKKEDFIEIGKRPPEEVLKKFKKMREERNNKLIEEKKEEERSNAIKQKILALEKPLKYVNEHQKTVELYKPYDGEINWSISSLPHVTSFNNSKKIYINTATFVNNIDKIKQIEIFDANGNIHVLNFKEKDESIENYIFIFEEKVKYGSVILVVSKNLEKINGDLRLDGVMNRLYIKENYGYVFN